MWVPPFFGDLYPGMWDKIEALPWTEAMRPATRALVVYRIEVWGVAFGLVNRDREGISALGVDELHWGRGKKSDNYATLIYQIVTGCRRLLWVGLKRT